ncbi:unnamed protein product [Adineta ricciae]|uniref:TIR domain-containing protein n=2 Tax=Adineta ricciae TaxID=249248 RepID=A0A814YP18_ADIRI|nr:unnamed protein product [Adineta ricciae]
MYRGANMDAAQITQYEKMAKDKTLCKTFQAYTSCTRIRSKAKALGNTLFTMELINDCTMDLSPYSKYPEEEEELIMPGVCFRVKSVTFDQKKNRHLITLELKKKVPTTDIKTNLPVEKPTTETTSTVSLKTKINENMVTGPSTKIPTPAAAPPPPSGIAKKHIFLAYAENDESDAAMVQKVKNYFIQRRFRVYHPRKNEDVNTQIANGIEKAAVVLVFSSLSFEKSKSGLKLLNYADQNKTPILSVKIDEDYLPLNWLGAILAPAKSCSNNFDEIMQSLASLEIKTSDLVLERGEKNEPQVVEEILFQGGAESGNLKASFYESGKEFPMKFKFLGLKNGKVVGQGNDKDGDFTLTGEYKITDRLGRIEMQKQHVGKQPVKCQGKVSFQELNCNIEGQWKTREASDKFSMNLTLPRPYTGTGEVIPPPQISRKKGTKVLISYCPCQFEFAQKLSKALIAKGIPAVCPPMKVHEMIKIATQKARVVVPLMSQAYEASNTAKYVLSYVDEAGIPIVPVKAQNPYTQSGWLGVICAGALWTQMTDANEFDKKLDELISQLQPYTTDCDDQDEQDDILVDDEYVEGYYLESGKEISMEFDMFSLINGYIAGEGEDDIGSFVISGEYYDSPVTKELKFEFKKHYIENYDVYYSGIITEEDSILSFDGEWNRNNISDVFHLDARRFEPSRSQRSHVMLSYQWDSQKFVKKIAGKLKEKNIPIWFDIGGDMKGNINAAMANGVQEAAVIVSFDTVAYSKSVNCKKELTFAKLLEKNILPVLLEDEKGFENTWLGNAIKYLDKVNMKNESDFDSSFNVLLQRIEQALEQEENEDESEAITRFEGGVVQGKYYGNGQVFDLKFDFFSLIDGSVLGQGGEDEDAFTLAGNYDNEGNISFKEQYVEKHLIEYKGKLICDEFGGFKIEGIWKAHYGTGKFHLESINDYKDGDDDDDASEGN